MPNLVSEASVKISSLVATGSSIKQWPAQLRPRERLLAQGAASLSDAELLAIFMRTGSRGKSALQLGQELLTEAGSLRALFSAEWNELSRHAGLGPAKFALLQAALELAKRSLSEDMREGRLLDKPAAVRKFLRLQLAHAGHESFAVLLLDTRKRLIAYREMFRGTLDQARVYPREIVKLALTHHAAAIILAHNHPSGHALPSRCDIDLTRVLIEALRLVEVDVIDHFIVTRSTVYSFADNGLLRT